MRLLEALRRLVAVSDHDGCHRCSVGILGYRYVEGMPWIDSLLNASMILGGMGPVGEMHRWEGKVFASFYALYSCFCRARCDQHSDDPSHAPRAPHLPYRSGRLFDRHSTSVDKEDH